MDVAAKEMRARGCRQMNMYWYYCGFSKEINKRQGRTSDWFQGTRRVSYIYMENKPKNLSST